MNIVRPPGGQWKERLIVGHNVSFDRSYIKEQYLLKVGIQQLFCFFPFSFVLFGLILAFCFHLCEGF